MNLQKKAANALVQMDNVIIDTHMSIRGNQGFLPGLPEWGIRELKRISASCPPNPFMRYGEFHLAALEIHTCHFVNLLKISSEASFTLVSLFLMMLTVAPVYIAYDTANILFSS